MTVMEQHAESMRTYAERVQQEGVKELYEMHHKGSRVFIALAMAYEAIYQRAPAGQRHFDPRVDISGHGFVRSTLAEMYLSATGHRYEVIFTMVPKHGVEGIFVPNFEVKSLGFAHAACNQHAKREYLKELIEDLKKFELVI